MKSLRSLASLFLLRSCLTCGGNIAEGSELCPTCLPSTILRLHRGRVGKVQHFSALEYNAVTAKIILLAKEENLQAARTILARSIAFALNELFAKSEWGANLIPVPSRPAANRKRGFIHTQELGLSVVKLLKKENVNVLPILEVFGTVKDQSLLTARERSENIHQQMRLKRRAILPSVQLHNILFDDLVTTGASAGESLRALNAENLAIWGVISACAT